MFMQQIPSKIFRGGKVARRDIPLSVFGPPDALMMEERCTTGSDVESVLLTKLALLVRNGILIRPGITKRGFAGIETEAGRIRGKNFLHLYKAAFLISFAQPSFDRRETNQSALGASE